MLITPSHEVFKDSDIDEEPMCCSGRSSSDLEKAGVRIKKLSSLMKVIELDGPEGEVEVFKAAADPCRLRILKLLKEGELCVCEIMTALDMTQPTASHHLRILEKAGLVRDRREGQWIFYSLSDPSVISLLEGADRISDSLT